MNKDDKDVVPALSADTETNPHREVGDDNGEVAGSAAKAAQPENASDTVTDERLSEVHCMTDSETQLCNDRLKLMLPGGHWYTGRQKPGWKAVVIGSAEERAQQESLSKSMEKTFARMDALAALEARSTDEENIIRRMMAGGHWCVGVRPRQ